MFFLDRNDIIEIENKNNFFTIFPSYIPHCVSPLYSKDNKDVSFMEQRFSLQFWISLKDEK